jgi:hypothetical protein
MVRLRSHFATVLRELRAADVAHLSPRQLSARVELISRLEAYAAAGRFPHNHVVAGRRVPVFRDEHRTLCAMGFLIASTGRTDIVDDVARTANLARIPELASDVRLHAWLDSAGLTVAEAARIQPMYGCTGLGCVQPEPEPAPTPASRVHPGYYVGSAAISALNGASTAVSLFNLSRNATVARRAASIGFVAGATQVILGAFVLDQNATAKSVGIANMALGSLTIGSSVWRMHHLPSESVVNRVTVAPLLPGNRNVGLVLAARM